MNSTQRLTEPRSGPYLTTAPTQIAAAIAILAALVLYLLLLGRSFVCPCGLVEIWQGALLAGRNSQQFADWYSLLHLVFGLGLGVFLARMRPSWPLGTRAVVALAGSVFWEAVENTPFVIALFDQAPGLAAYTGDSILNALGDTLFALVGFMLASTLPLAAVIAIAILCEIAVTYAIHDGLIVGSLRLLGVDLLSQAALIKG